MVAVAAALLPAACVPKAVPPPRLLSAGFDSAWARGLEDGTSEAHRDGTSGVFGVVGFATGFGLIFGSMNAALSPRKGTDAGVVILPALGLLGLMAAGVASQPSRVDLPPARLAEARVRGPTYGAAWEASYRQAVSRRRQRELGLGHTAGLFLSLVAVAWAATHPYT